MSAPTNDEAGAEDAGLAPTTETSHGGNMAGQTAPSHAPSRPDRIIATRAFLRGAITAGQRIDTQVCDAALAHAGGSVDQAEDHLHAAIYLAGQLQTLLGQAKQALDMENTLTATQAAA